MLLMWLNLFILKQLENYHVGNYRSHSAYSLGAWLGVFIHYWRVNPYFIGCSSCGDFGKNHTGPKTVRFAEMRACQTLACLFGVRVFQLFNMLYEDAKRMCCGWRRVIGLSACALIFLSVSSCFLLILPSF